MEAGKRRLDLGIAGKFPTLGLSEPFEDRSQVSRSYRLGRTLACRQMQHGARDFVLRLRRQSPHCFKCLLQELGHGENMSLGWLIGKAAAPSVVLTTGRR